jgi:hypothetical protein
VHSITFLYVGGRVRPRSLGSLTCSVTAANYIWPSRWSTHGHCSLLLFRSGNSTAWDQIERIEAEASSDALPSPPLPFCLLSLSCSTRNNPPLPSCSLLPFEARTPRSCSNPPPSAPPLILGPRPCPPRHAFPGLHSTTVTHPRCPPLFPLRRGVICRGRTVSSKRCCRLPIHSTFASRPPLLSTPAALFSSSLSSLLPATPPICASVAVPGNSPPRLSNQRSPCRTALRSRGRRP